MPDPSQSELDSLWARHSAQWREPAQIASQWDQAAAVDPKLLQYKVRGDWWQTLEKLGITLLVTREYEHLIMAMNALAGKPQITYMTLPHPSGMAADRAGSVLHLASTRNPNQVYDLMPVTGVMSRLDTDAAPLENDLAKQPLLPVRSRFYPGSYYMHELALIGGTLYANSVGQNAIVRLDADGRSEIVWYPKCIEADGQPIIGQNHIQLNSIAAGDSLADSYFSASTDKISARRPGHQNFLVDKRGVIFSGKTREVIARGLTRPHSATLHEGRVWVNNSGYGELVIAEDGGITPVIKLPGWTRGLCIYGQIAFVGTSRVIPRFSQYAPGLDVAQSQCGIHAVDLQSGQLLGSLIWSYGNQIFDIEWMPTSVTSGFPFSIDMRTTSTRIKKLFYTFQTALSPKNIAKD